MYSKPYAFTKQLVVAIALALGASGVALADDSSMQRFGGDSYNYFNQQQALGKTAANPAWRQTHPNGLTESELQALSASSLAASAFQTEHPVVASAPADPSWRQSHPNGLTERELQALSSSNLAVWQGTNGSSASSDWTNVAQTARK
jgi:hypothetical protein